MIITREYLRANPTHIFVFGDNMLHSGYAGAAALRDEPNVFGFITKKRPIQKDSAFYTPEEYKKIYLREIGLLIVDIQMHPDNLFLISKLGSGLANRFGIFEAIIEPHIKNDLASYSNVKFLW